VVRDGLPLRMAAVAAIASPLTDDAESWAALILLIESYLP
jgi:hypothetical protein